MTTRDGPLALEARVADGPDVYRFRTDPSVTAPEGFRTAELLLCETLWERDPGHLLCVEANYGVTGVVLAPVAKTVSMTESGARAAGLCADNAARNHVDVEVELLADVTELEACYDVAAYAPREYTPISLGKQRIVDAMSRLRPGGEIYVAASKRAGLTRYETCLEGVAADVTRVAAGAGCHALRASRPAAFDPPTYLTPTTLEPAIQGTSITLRTVPGLFAADGLDHGTRLLAESVSIADGESVLDLCCGYGALGTYAATVADCSVWPTDDDRVATACAECSVDRSGVDGTVVTAHGVDGVRGRSFDRVLCNPPTHAADRVLDDVFGGAHDVLVDGGTLTVVHHQALDLSDHLAAFARVERVAEGEEHVVVRARR